MATTTRDDTATLWVCIGCLFADQGDESTGDDTWSLVDGDESVTTVTPGLMADEHDEHCRAILGWQTGQCQCEEREFSWQRCDGCGSTLGGSRHAYTAWLIDGDL